MTVRRELLHRVRQIFSIGEQAQAAYSVTTRDVVLAVVTASCPAST